MDYRVDLLSRETGAAKAVYLQEAPTGWYWIDEQGQDIEELPPQPTRMKARRQLEKHFLWTHEIFWPIRQPYQPGSDLNECCISLRISRPMFAELKLAAGLAGKPARTYLRMILQHYLRPGTLPPLDAAYIDMILAERDRKHKRP